MGPYRVAPKQPPLESTARVPTTRSTPPCVGTLHLGSMRDSRLFGGVIRDVGGRGRVRARARRPSLLAEGRGDERTWTGYPTSCVSRDEVIACFRLPWRGCTGGVVSR